MAKSTTTAKRSFGVNTTDIPETLPLLENGFYAGVVTNTSITKASDNSSRIKIVEEQVYDRDDKKWDKTGEYIIDGTIYFGVALNSKKAIKVLQRDEPKFFGRIRLKFDKESLTYVPNQVLGGFLAALGIKDIDFNAQAEQDFVYNDAIEIPEELAHVPNIVDMLNSVEYQKILFGYICQAANGLPCIASIVKTNGYPDTTKQINALGQGQYQDSCGIVAYTEGAEFDLED
jgi:hypothetical protein